MDLVLICRKRKSLDMPLITLDSIVEEIFVGLPIKSQGYNTNSIFLHFMGELIKAASAVWEKQFISYEWFTTALSKFYLLMKENIVESKESSLIELELKHIDDFTE